MPSEMQARIARALVAEDPIVMSTLTGRELEELALAVMKAMREPTPAMERASRIEQPCPCGRRHTVWGSNRLPAMFDAEISLAEGGSHDRD